MLKEEQTLYKTLKKSCGSLNAFMDLSWCATCTRTYCGATLFSYWTSKTSQFFLHYWIILWSCSTVCCQPSDKADTIVLLMKSLCRPPLYIFNWLIQLRQHDVIKAMSSGFKALLFKKVYYLFLSIFCHCLQHVPETASVCAILNLVPVAGSLVTRALELARVSLQSFLY